MEQAMRIKIKKHTISAWMTACMVTIMPFIAAANEVTGKIDNLRDSYAIPIAGSIAAIGSIYGVVMWALDKMDFMGMVKWIFAACLIGVVAGVVTGLL